MIRVALSALAALLLAAAPVWADRWAASLTAHEHGPSRFVAVDKRSQTFLYFEQKSPIAVRHSLACTTGSALGDKRKEGDLKTPEGVYFVTGRMDSGLDWEKYGDLAFPLNFPNPVDIIKGKSGHGIWIHGRGPSITPFETQGCVALNTPDLRGVEAEIEQRMPVLIADEVNWNEPSEEVKKQAAEVVAATVEWAEAWRTKSSRFFELHDPVRFGISQGQPFAAFKSHKEKLFKGLPWIQVELEDIRAVPGPDYWVTYFIQFYRSPTLISQGVKRLYWQRGDKGQWVVVGMEFEQTPPTLAAKYTGGSSRPTAGAPALPASSRALAAEGERETPKPDRVSEEDVKPALLAGLGLKGLPEPRFESRRPAPDAPSSAAPVPEAPKAPPVPTIPAVSAAPAAPAIPAGPEKTLAAAPFVEKPLAAAAPGMIVTVEPGEPTSLAAPAAPPTAAFSPAQAVPAVAAKAAAPDRSRDAEALIESWRAAWEKGRLDEYLAFYHDRAVQDRREGKSAIRDQKETLWTDKPPRRVQISDIRLTPHKGGFRAEFVQEYAGGDGTGDKGRKTLVLTPTAKGLVIVAETWSRM